MIDACSLVGFDELDVVDPESSEGEGKRTTGEDVRLRLTEGPDLYTHLTGMQSASC